MRIIFASGVAVILIAALFAALNAVPGERESEDIPGASVRVNGQTVHISIADTPEARAQGLSGRTELSFDEGMLFVFPEDGAYGFWMKDMLISIDIIWLSNDGAVVDMALNVSPDTYPTSFLPARPARYVLEVPAGFAERHNVRVGDTVEL